MYISAYDTTLCRNFKTDTLTKELSKVAFNSIRANNSSIPSDVILITPEHQEVPQFAHPFILQSAIAHDNKPSFCVDIRSCSRIVGHELVISGKDEYEFQMTRVLLTKFVAEKGLEDLGAMANFPMQFFITWLSEAIGRVKRLDPRVQMNVGIICGVYFLSAFRDESGPYSEKEKLRYSGLINRVMRYPAQDVIDLIDKLSPMATLGDFSNNVAEHSGSVRMNDINPPFIYTAVGGGWFGFNAREVLAVSLEHLPTLYSLVFAAATQRAFKKTVVAGIVERISRHGDSDAFVKQMLRVKDSLLQR